jgi:hypothetical protein
MFHGGTNPEGKATTLQESQATGYPQDLPVKSYDFQAPLGEFGQMHPSFRDLKSIHLFLQDFGSALAPMSAYFPEHMPTGKQDRDTPRMAVRSDSNSGFVFLNNYQKDHPLPVQKAVQVQLKLASGTMSVPRQPIDIPSGAYTFWPVNLPVGETLLEQATLQPLCHLDDPDTFLFFAWPGIAPEFAFRAGADTSVEAPRAHVAREGGRVTIDHLTPGLDAAIEIRGKNGRRTQILVLSREQARNIWKAQLGGRERLLYSPADVYFEGNSVHLNSSDPAKLRLALFPDSEHGPEGVHRSGMEGIFASYSVAVAPVDSKANVQLVREAASSGPVRMGKEVALAPEESAFEGAARWKIHVPDVSSPVVRQVLLRITYQGDIARIYAGNRLITDDFYHGAPWEIGLEDIPAADLKQGLRLEILPLRSDAPIYLASEAKPSIAQGSQVARLSEARLIPVYRAVAAVRP